jgi:nucleotide-binding universal stress UspA family protein
LERERNDLYTDSFNYNSIKILKILVPHDGSVFSDKALKKAIVFANKLNCEIVLLNVLDLDLLQSELILKFLRHKAAIVKSRTELLKYLKTGNELMLRQKLQAVKKNGLRIRSRVDIGPISEVIVKIARLEKVEFIIMGSRGSSDKSSVNKLRIGSIATRVSELAECPVMIIK